MLKQKTKALEQLLGVGDFSQACVLVAELGEPHFSRALQRLPSGTPWRMRAAAAVAEVHFYRGENEKARTLVEEAASKPQWLHVSNDAVPARARLQRVEYDYSLREFAGAKSSAKQLLGQYEDVQDHLAIAEAACYLARCEMRLHNPLSVFTACEQCFENLASLRSASRQALHWRMGVAMLVSGFTAAKAGHASWSELYGARVLLTGTGDVVGRANADHAIGAALRSRARSRAEIDAALAYFTNALVVYEEMGHKVNIARVHTNFGRTYLNMGCWTNAETHFKAALNAVHGMSDTVAQRRQRAECLVCMAWLYRESETQDLPHAIDSAREALDELSRLRDTVDAPPPGEITVEAHIALGECLFDDRKVIEAREHFVEALKWAERRSINRLLANSHLALAELELSASNGNSGPALSHYEKAIDLLDKDSSRYLQEKAMRVKKSIESSTDMWFISREQVLKPGNLVKAIATLEKWGIQRVEANWPTATLQEKAAYVGLKSGPGYLKWRQRVENMSESETLRIEPPPSPREQT